MIDLVYSVYENKIVYNPVKGVSVQTALQNAKKIAKLEKKQVELTINNVLLIITEGSNLTIMLQKYFMIMERQYYEKMFHSHKEKEK